MFVNAATGALLLLALSWPVNGLMLGCSNSTNENSVRCSVGTESELHSSLRFISSSLLDRNHTYESLHVSIEATRLEEGAFRGLRFKHLYMTSPDLVQVHKNVFAGIEDTVTELTIFKSKLTNTDPEEPDYDLFKALTSLVNLKFLTILKSDLEAIPDEAFAPRSQDKIQESLLEIYIVDFEGKSSVSSIGSNAFYSLPSLRLIDLTNQSVRKIKKDAFAMSTASTNQLVIDLSGNDLTDDSFAIGTFDETQRPTRLHLGLPTCNVELNHLEEKVFRPFFEADKKNRVDLGKSCDNLACDCQSLWLSSFTDQISNFKCYGTFNKRFEEDCKNDQENKEENEEKKEEKKEAEKEDGENEVEVELTSEIEIPRPKPKPISSVLAGRVDSCRTSTCQSVAAEILSYLNKSANPCDDFYSFACGRWEHAHLFKLMIQILSHDSSDYDSFVKMREKVLDNLNEMLEITSTQPPVKEPKSIGLAMKVYSQCLNYNKNQSVEMIKEKLKKFNSGWPILSRAEFDLTHYHWNESLIKILAGLRQDVLISLESFINNESNKQLKITYPSFVLSKRKLIDTHSIKKIKDTMSYVQYILSVVTNLNPEMKDRNETFDTALEIFRFERDLAKIASKSSGDDFLIEQKLGNLKCLVEDINWNQLIKSVGATHGIELTDQTKVLVDVHYIIRLSELLRRTSKRLVANYLGWRIVESIGFITGGRQFLAAQFEFHDYHSDEGTKSKWRQCLDPVKQVLDMALTRRYADFHLPAQKRLDVLEIAVMVKNAYREIINETEWLEPDKKLKLINRVDKIKMNVGYPEWILDNDKLDKHYESLISKLESTMEVVKKNNSFVVDLYEDLWSAQAKSMLSDIGAKIDTTVYWDVSTFKVGAIYDIANNIIVVPLGILHPPFYDSNKPKYLNFGFIGSIIGHELSHALVPRYNGSELLDLVEPWDKQMFSTFLSKAKCFVHQYSNMTDEEADANLDGLKTFEEDISDLEGVRASYRAYDNYLKNNSTRLSVIPQLQHEFTYKQLFFIAYAQKWCGFTSPAQIRVKILVGGHSPEKYRVNGALANFDKFASAFKCPAKRAMNPSNKCSLWSTPAK